MNDLDTLIQYARGQGWHVEMLGKHQQFVSPTGERIVTAVTPSDYRGFRNDVARLRRAGLPVPRKRAKPKRHEPSPFGEFYEQGCDDNNIKIDLDQTWPFVRAIISQWRSDSWFDEGGVPISEEEWHDMVGVTERRMVATALVYYTDAEADKAAGYGLHAHVIDKRKLATNRPTDRHLVISVCAVKYWTDILLGDYSTVEKCMCGYLANDLDDLARHVVKEIERGYPEHGPEGLRLWTDPEEVRLLLEGQENDNVEQYKELLETEREKRREAEAELRNVKDRVRAALG